MTESVPGPESGGSTGPEASPGAGGASAAGTPREGGMSTGAKVLFACLGLTVLGIIGIAVAVMVGGFALKRGVESAIGTMEEQQRATRLMERLEDEHPFRPPPDGVVGEERMERYLAVTDDAWEEMRAWADDFRELRESRGEQGGLPRLRELAANAGTMGSVVRSRVALAEALDANDISLPEYIWTGIQLDNAADVLEGDRPAESIPEANVALVEAHSGSVPRLDSGSGEGDGSGVVLSVAVLWGMADFSTWQSMGLDTLGGR